MNRSFTFYRHVYDFGGIYRYWDLLTYKLTLDYRTHEVATAVRSNDVMNFYYLCRYSLLYSLAHRGAARCSVSCASRVTYTIKVVSKQQQTSAKTVSFYKQAAHGLWSSYSWLENDYSRPLLGGLGIFTSEVGPIDPFLVCDQGSLICLSTHHYNVYRPSRYDLGHPVRGCCESVRLENLVNTISQKLIKKILPNFCHICTWLHRCECGD